MTCPMSRIDSPASRRARAARRDACAAPSPVLRLRGALRGGLLQRRQVPPREAPEPPPGRGRPRRCRSGGRPASRSSSAARSNRRTWETLPTSLSSAHQPVPVGSAVIVYVWLIATPSRRPAPAASVRRRPCRCRGTRSTDPAASTTDVVAPLVVELVKEGAHRVDRARFLSLRLDRRSTGRSSVSVRCEHLLLGVGVVVPADRGSRDPWGRASSCDRVDLADREPGALLALGH